ncbi:hypothetical protein [Deinococcus arcticus]|uniref:Uncharacterized protein n=1 Tax=Deinococcus arcticus TaxID=2136176 RepID=A0A2T3W719_9DEIO|nr:hypothetical protein [Deinococcus arcticus]PTA67543.1 hypothetical protein C8263_11940 [Deinococcus arcticus]
MNPARAQWQALAPSVGGLLDELHGTFAAHDLTSTWTAGQRAQALHLVNQLRRAWQREHVALDDLAALDALTAGLNLPATVTCRARLEGVQGHFRRVAEATCEALAE